MRPYCGSLRAWCRLFAVLIAGYGLQSQSAPDCHSVPIIGQNPPEVCNGLDDDLDGQTDEDLERICYTACGMGSEVCVDGQWVRCTAPEPGTEACDGTDADCDGFTDCADPDCNGQTTVSGVYCETGAERSCGDGQDNDADGVTDCDDVDCVGRAPCVPSGSCCHPELMQLDPGGGAGPVSCIDDEAELRCEALLGTWRENLRCSELGPLCPTLGACCRATDSCLDLATEAECALATGGARFFPGRACGGLTRAECMPTGACCFGGGNCLDDIDANDCVSYGASFFRGRVCSDLSAVECPEPTTGACCHPQISYVDETGIYPVTCLDNLTRYKCDLFQGTWTSEGLCADLEADGSCPELGACCHGDGTCTTGVTAADCPDTFYPGDSCQNLDNNECPIMGACCSVNTATGYGTCADNVTHAGCAAGGGTMYAGRTCDSLTAAECPPVPTGACCHPQISYVDETGVHPVTCLDGLTRYKCDLLQGTWTGAALCANVEAAGDCPAIGACCHGDGTCTDRLTPGTCNGTFYRGEACGNLDENECPRTGACCVIDAASGYGSCGDDVTAADCNTAGGTLYAGRTCDALTAAECPPVPRGACCHPHISYVDETGVRPVTCLDDLTRYKCDLLHGTWTADALCAILETAGDCPVLGACCHGDGTCTAGLTETACNGTFYGDRSCGSLSQVECPSTGACCVISATTGYGSCGDDVTAAGCNTAGGTLYAGRTCSSLSAAECPPVPRGACCHPQISYVDETGVRPVTCLDDLTRYKCDLLHGTWTADALCANLETAGDCPVLGACCHGDGTCTAGLTETACNGTFYGDRSCGSLSQVECPSTGACCVISATTGYGSCGDNVTAAGCNTAGGTLYAGRTCSSLSAAECPPEPLGACCHPQISYVDETGVRPVTCLDNVKRYKCDLLHGTWTRDALCANLETAGDCPVLGACCHGDGTCTAGLTETACNGTFYGDRSCGSLSQVECPSTGACCVISAATGYGTCADNATVDGCATAGGTLYAGRTCDSLTTAECPPEPLGACCHPQISYVDETGVRPVTCLDNVKRYKCDLLHGTWTRDALCAELAVTGECPTLGACCYPDGTCTTGLTETACNGTFYGDRSCGSLSQVECPSTGACCVISATTGYGTCADNATVDGCATAGGTLYAGRTCDSLTTAECPPEPLGACCHPHVSYVDETGVRPVTCLDNVKRYKCDLLHGTWTRDALCAELAVTGECPTLGACCYPDGTCTTGLTETACNGTFYGDRSCGSLSQAECPTTGACCVIDPTTGARNCGDDVTPADCNTSGGTLYAGRTCDSLTAVECPPEPTGACCHPRVSYVDETGVRPVTCLDDQTRYRCDLLRGTWTRDALCADLQSSGDCPTLGACCHGDGTCTVGLTAAECDGSFYGDRTCGSLSEAECPSTGACCVIDPTTGYGSCGDDVTPADCTTAGGTLYAGRTCSSLTDAECPPEPIGACCHPHVSYVDETGVYPVSCLDRVTRARCAILHGDWTANALCAVLETTGECPRLGACCHRDGTCTDSSTATDCVGTFYEGESCGNLDEQECPSTGACCVIDPATGAGNCGDAVNVADCATVGGTLYAGRTCDSLTDAECPPEPIGACCHPHVSYVDETGVYPVSCLDGVTRLRCAILHGTWTADTPCAVLEVEGDCPPLGACCHGDGTCANSSTRAECAGTFYEGESCGNLTEDECPSLGACCVVDPASGYGACADSVTPDGCTTAGGTLYAGRTCGSLTAAECRPLPTGACCHPHAGFVDPVTGDVFWFNCFDEMPEERCVSMSGTWLVGERCADLMASGECPLQGACCHGDGTCTEFATERTCDGTFYERQACQNLSEEECPTMGACCVVDPASGYGTCADSVTEGHCAEAGGTLYANRLCSSLTAAECPSPPTGACCHPAIRYVDAFGVHAFSCIDDLQEIHCAMWFGTWIEGAQCAALEASGECPPLGACCHGDGTCTDAITAGDCDGTFYEEDLCYGLGEERCPTVGACCVSGYCYEALPAADCEQLAGSYFQGKTCAELAGEDCPRPPVGACCRPHQTYSDGTGVRPAHCVGLTTERDCTSLAGMWVEGVSCATVIDSGQCAPPGACCLPDGSCEDFHDDGSCARVGGAFHEGMTCGGVTCQSLTTGACCMGLGGCADGVEQAPCEVDARGLFFLGATCAGIYAEGGCPPLGACCIPDYGCVERFMEAYCRQDFGGVFYEDQGCSQIDCQFGPAPLGACCHPDLWDLGPNGAIPVVCLDAVSGVRCTYLEGQWMGANLCDELMASGECEMIGACCITGAGCIAPMTGSECESNRGVFFNETGCTNLPPGTCQ